MVCPFNFFIMSKGFGTAFKQQFLAEGKVIDHPVALSANIVEYLREFEDLENVEILFDLVRENSRICRLIILIHKDSGLTTKEFIVDSDTMSLYLARSVHETPSIYGLLAILLNHKGFIPLPTMKSLVFFADGLLYYEAGLSMFADSLDPEHPFSSIFSKHD